MGGDAEVAAGAVAHPPRLAEEAIVSIHVYDKARRSLQGEHALLAYEAVPMHALRPGYRVVRLRAPTGSRLRNGCLLVRVIFPRSTAVPCTVHPAAWDDEWQ